jgi:hypothetical protein
MPKRKRIGICLTFSFLPLKRISTNNMKIKRKEEPVVKRNTLPITVYIYNIYK